MSNQKTIIDNYGNVVKKAVILKDDKLLYTELKEGERLVDYCNKDMLKPVWNGTEWIEKATEKEIKEWKDSKKIVSQEPSKEETLIKELAMLKINDMKKDKTINDLSKTLADLKIKIMKMEGSN